MLPVPLHDGSRFTKELTITDPLMDTALLDVKIPKRTHVSTHLADSGKLKIRQNVLVTGHSCGPSWSPEEKIERAATLPSKIELQSLPDLPDVRSLSIVGLSDVKSVCHHLPRAKLSRML